MKWKCLKCGANGVIEVRPGLFDIQCPMCGEMDEVEVV
jgi:hypothetical protein